MQTVVQNAENSGNSQIRSDVSNFQQPVTRPEYIKMPLAKRKYTQLLVGIYMPGLHFNAIPPVKVVGVKMLYIWVLRPPRAAKFPSDPN